MDPYGEMDRNPSEIDSKNMEMEEVHARECAKLLSPERCYEISEWYSEASEVYIAQWEELRIEAWHLRAKESLMIDSAVRSEEEGHQKRFMQLRVLASELAGRMVRLHREISQVEEQFDAMILMSEVYLYEGWESERKSRGHEKAEGASKCV